MLDRHQHLKLFLTGSGDSPEDADTVVSDERVQQELDQQPVNSERLFEAVCRVSHFKFNSSQEHQFLLLFGRYRQVGISPVSEKVIDYTRLTNMTTDKKSSAGPMAAF